MATATTTTPEATEILISKIERGSDTQARAAANKRVIEELTWSLVDHQEKGDLDAYIEQHIPRVVLFFDGARYHPADGWHRIDAFTDADLESIPVLIYQGSERDARIFACGANRFHGANRTDADKRRAVEIMLADSEWSSMSSRAIADYCGVSHSFVEKIRQERAEADPTGVDSSSTDEAAPAAAKRTGKDGKARTPKAKAGPSASKSAAKPAKKKNGAEKVSAAKRKQARAAFGVVVRFVDLVEEAEIAKDLEQIAEAMAEHWGK